MKLYWRRVILYITAMGMESCWLYTLMALLNEKVADGRLSIFGLLLLYPLSFGFNRLLRQLRWHKAYVRGITWLAWVIAMMLMLKIQLFGGVGWSDSAWLLALPQAIAQIFFTFKPELLILLSSAVIWWLGRRIAYTRINFTVLVTEFQFGLAILLITFFVNSQLEITTTASIPTAIIFFIFALLGISIAHAEEGASWLAGLYRGHWSGLLLLSIGLVLIFGLVISLIITPDLLQVVVDAVKWLWRLVMKAIAFLANLLPAAEPGEPPPVATMPEVTPSEGPVLIIPDSVRSILRFGLNILFGAAAVLILWRISSSIYGLLRRKLASTAGGEVEPIPGAFREDLLRLLKGILNKLLWFRPFFRRGGSKISITPEIYSVRQIYRQLLRWAAEGGYPRLVSQTPHEYYYTLVDLLPEALDDLDFVTRQYVGTRYGHSLPNEDELNELRQRWYRLRKNRLKRITGELASQ